MKVKKINDEVIAVDQSIATLARQDVRDLVERAKTNKRKRMRICVHRDESDKHQEMFIVHTKDTYVRPHRHAARAESFLVLEGTVDLILFDDEGQVTEVIPMSDYSSGKCFYYRMAAPVYHTLLITSDHLIFKEGTTGPFVRSETLFAPWSPEETDTAGVRAFTADLQRKMRASKK